VEKKTQSSNSIANLLKDLRRSRTRSHASSTPPTPTATPSPVPSPRNAGEQASAAPDFRRSTDSPEFVGTHQGPQIPALAPALVIKKEPLVMIVQLQFFLSIMIISGVIFDNF
jgi:hypothetical protein